jgi:hypothetical protein
MNPEGIMKKILFLISAIFMSFPAHAQYTYNNNVIADRIVSVITYAHDNSILFNIPNMPQIPGCAGHYFVITPDLPTDNRQQLLSRLLVAYSSKEAINIGYDGQTCNSIGYIVVFRVG